jgi:hypothetical protein
MFNISNIIPCMANLSRTQSIELSYDDIVSCDEGPVKPAGECFIKKYHHFIYDGPGVVKCKYIKDVGDYDMHKMKRVGVFS